MAAMAATVVITPIIYIGVVYNALYYVSYHPNSDFDKARWQADEGKRYEITDHLIESELLIGRTKLEVINLLGENDTIYDNMIYNIGFEPGLFPIDPSGLVIDFKEGKVSRVYVREF